MSTVRPSGRVRMQIRLDEGADTGVLQVNMQRTPALQGTSVLDTSAASIADVATALASNQAERKVVQQASGLLSPGDAADRLSRLGAERDRLQQSFGDKNRAQQRPGGLVVGPSDDLVVLGSFMPKRIKIRRNSIREADECEVEIDLRDAPIDPRMVRAMFLDVTLGTVQPNDFEQGVTGGKGARRADGSPVSVLDAPRGQELVYKSATRFVGFAEEWTNELQVDGDRVIIRARDLTTMFINRYVPDGQGIDLTLPIREGIQKLVNSYEALRGLRVFYGNPKPGDNFGGSDAGPIPAQSAPRALKPRRGKLHKQHRTGQERVTLWDHITDVTVGLGLVPVIRGFHLFLIQPRTFFAGTSNAVRMSYGQNLTSWKLSRKFSREKVPTIQVRCYDPTIQRSRWGQWPVYHGHKTSGVFGIDLPPKPERPNDVSASGKAEEQVQIYTVKGLSDGGTLAEAARAIYEQIGRREIEGTIETREVTSLPAEDPSKPLPEEGDLLNLQSGDPIEAVIASLNAASNGDTTNTQAGGSLNSAQQLTSMAPGQRREYLVQLGYSQKAAQQIADSYDRIRLLKVFRVHNVDINFEAGEGIDISIGFQNFLVVREAATSGEQSETPIISGITQGSDSLASKRLRAASGAGVTAGTDAIGGIKNATEFASDSSSASTDGRIAGGAQRKGG